MFRKKRVPLHLHALNEKEVEYHQNRTAEGRYTLNASEIYWRDRAAVLEDHGYELRPRLKPGWTPSWEGTDLNPTYCEDSYQSIRQKVVDAIRIKDRKRVFIMNLERESVEGYIYRHLVDPGRQDGCDHHIVPLLDSFQDDREPDLEFFVMPLLRSCNDPPFETAAELVDYFKQMLECLVYMHDSGVAHRDCSIGNMMMDAPGVFPSGFHPCEPDRDGGGTLDIEIVPRRRSWKPVRYYIIDFGISRLYEIGDDRLVVGDDGAERDIPEMSNLIRYDPFPADVFIMGNAFKKYFLAKYENLDYLRPFLDSMTAKDPSERPSAAEALKELQSVIKKEGFFSLRRRLTPQGKRKGRLAVAVENVGVIIDTAMYPARYIARLPNRAFCSMHSVVTTRHKSPK